MRTLTFTALLAMLTLSMFASVTVAAEEPEKYDIESASVSLSSTQAGAHPDFTTTFELSTGEGKPFARTRDVVVTLPAGIFGNPEAFPKCTSVQLGTNVSNSNCPQDAQVGVIESTLVDPISTTFVNSPIYNMPAPSGDALARFGFYAGSYPFFLNVRLDPDTYSLVAKVEGAPNVLLARASTKFWGVPASPEHDEERLTPAESAQGSPPSEPRGSDLPEIPFMTNPVRCGVQGIVGLTVRSYQLPDQPRTRTLPFPTITGCGMVDFAPTASLAPTTTKGTSGTGLNYGLNLPTKGLQFGHLNYGSELKRAEVVLPEGMTVNPSQADGLAGCSAADLSREAYNSPPNVGCPEASKIGSVVAETPVIDRAAVGSLYVAKPYENPFGSLFALYMVLKIPDRGVLVKLPGKAKLDPVTGRITTVFADIPQLPVADFRLQFREGARAPLVTPRACGSYDAASNLMPWSAEEKVVRKENSFTITSGPNGEPCPMGGLPRFAPGLTAGTINNAAGAYSPFSLRLTRTDSEQEMTHLSIKLPPGLLGKLAGIPFCSDLAISLARARVGSQGGEEEFAAPACPAASEIGTTLVGSGVGDVQVYVPGRVYLAGPYNGSPLSIVAITAAKAGPFDLGTVVVRQALRINPETAEVFIDASGSDPIPHIIKGVPVHLRDIRVYIDRPDFTLNPTDCTRTSVAATVLGAGLDFFSQVDDRPATVSTPFQAADCGSLDFAPRLSLRLLGGTRRGQVPGLKATLTIRPGDANIGRAAVSLPSSQFLEQANIGTVCTRVQFVAGAVPGEKCPRASVYGSAEAISPLLDEPLRGPVFLRANGGERPLPDLVAALHSGKIDINLVGYIDSVPIKGRGLSRLRTTFASVPDAPVTRFTLRMAGGKKGLLVNSTNVCRGTHRAKAVLTGQNGRRHLFAPKLKPICGKGKSGSSKRK